MKIVKLERVEAGAKGKGGTMRLASTVHVFNVFVMMSNLDPIVQIKIHEK